ncbi:Piwi domain-containing protein [Pleurocapsa sp. FMAR1]|uniref:Piwi domain-containing protein n=1 Tax=Pleurocapsa sp. FMAR1 TaxID=3040204 RepID=UPI0029C6FBB9|nr:Piwi domain-containing protein [Pleurocapsa sp. FMAR1]
MSNTHLSEIFPLTYSLLNIKSFRFSPKISRELGNSIGWHFSKQFPDVVVIWDKGSFWVLGQSNIEIPSREDWKIASEYIQEKLQDKLGDRTYFIQWVEEPKVTASVIAQLAIRILQINCRFSSEVVFNRDKVQVKRECKFWSETIEINNEITSAISLTSKTTFLYRETLEHFFNNHPERNEPEKLLTGLLVRDIDSGSSATIIELNGTIKEQREKLLKQASGSVSKEQLQIAPDDQPVVSIQFGKNSHLYDYALAALRPCVTSYTAKRFNIEYGTLLGHTKIRYQERQKLLSQYKQEADQILAGYDLKIASRCINSKTYSDLFWTPETKLEDTLMLFGNNVKCPKGKTLGGLSQGGVYSRHKNFEDTNRPIRLAILNFMSLPDKPFYDGLEQQLKQYKFGLHLTLENIKSASLEGLSEAEARAKVLTLIDEVVVVPPDLVLVFLPESDRGKDDSDGESIYAWVYSRLLRRKIASQIIYEKTMRGQLKHIFNQVVPGILAKLGNLPFVLAEPLPIADYFIGLDISRRPKKNGQGSINACACVRLYGKQGEFIKYQIASDSATEGEEIPAKILQDFLSSEKLKNKTILIYRDGVFRGKEVETITAWGKAIGSRFILVECAKSQIPRLYDLSIQEIQRNNKIEKISQLQAPTRCLALKLSSREAILVTTEVSEKVGVPRPLRLKVIEGGLSADIETIVDITLKLTLLHHGSLKDPRLPVPLFGADRIAYRNLQGIYPGELEGDIQYWL